MTYNSYVLETPICNNNIYADILMAHNLYVLEMSMSGSKTLIQYCLAYLRFLQPVALLLQIFTIEYRWKVWRKIIVTGFPRTEGQPTSEKNVKSMPTILNWFQLCRRRNGTLCNLKVFGGMNRQETELPKAYVERNWKSRQEDGRPQRSYEEPRRNEGSN